MPPTRDLASTLIESASMTELVDDGLAPLADELGASLAVLYRLTHHGLDSLTPRSMPKLMESYTSHYATQCPLQEVKRRHNPEVAVISDMLDTRSLRRSETFHDFYRVNSIERHLIARLTEVPYGRVDSGGVVFARSQHDPPFSETEVARLSALRPLLASVVERNRRLESSQRAQQGQSVLAAVLQSIDDSPMMIYDRDAQRIWTSTSAEALSALSDPTLAGQLTEAVRALMRDQLEGPPPPVELRLGALRVWLLRSRIDGSGEPYVLARLEGATSGELSAAARRFGLSPAEVVVLEALLDGKSNREIAGRLHLSIDTVRSHLRHIYSKLDVHTRAQAIVVTAAALRPNRSPSPDKR